MTSQKRIVTKVGDIFKTVSVGKKHRYLQLVAIDRANLNSDVIVVFSAAMDRKVNIDEVAQGPIEFYTHTSVSQGVRLGLWERVGNASVYINLENLHFKYHRGKEHVDALKRVAAKMNAPHLEPPFDMPYWDAWSLPDEQYHSISGLAGEKLDAQDGAILPARAVMSRLGTV